MDKTRDGVPSAGSGLLELIGIVCVEQRVNVDEEVTSELDALSW